MPFSNSETAVELHLHSFNMLHATSAVDTEPPVSTEFDLKKYSGNAEGSFSISGIGFSHSARDIHLQENILCAELCNSFGKWTYCEIHILVNPLAGNKGVSHSLAFVGAAEDLVDLAAFSFDSYIEVRTRGLDTLVGLCRIPDGKRCLGEDPAPPGTYGRRVIGLSKLLGNSNGQFDLQGQNFEDSARYMRVREGCLVAELKDVNGRWQSDSIRLSAAVVCLDGKLQPLMLPREAKLESRPLRLMSIRHPSTQMSHSSSFKVPCIHSYPIPHPASACAGSCPVPGVIPWSAALSPQRYRLTSSMTAYHVVGGRHWLRYQR